MMLQKKGPRKSWVGPLPHDFKQHKRLILFLKVKRRIVIKKGSRELALIARTAPLVCVIRPSLKPNFLTGERYWLRLLTWKDNQRYLITNMPPVTDKISRTLIAFVKHGFHRHDNNIASLLQLLSLSSEFLNWPYNCGIAVTANARLNTEIRRFVSILQLSLRYFRVSCAQLWDCCYEPDLFDYCINLVKFSD